MESCGLSRLHRTAFSQVGSGDVASCRFRLVSSVTSRWWLPVFLVNRLGDFYCLGSLSGSFCSGRPCPVGLPVVLSRLVNFGRRLFSDLRAAKSWLLSLAYDASLRVGSCDLASLPSADWWLPSLPFWSLLSLPAVASVCCFRWRPAVVDVHCLLSLLLTGGF